MKKEGYVNHNLWQNTPDNIRDFLKDPRFTRLSPIAKDAAVAKFLNMSYGKLQEYKVQHDLFW